MTSVFQLIFQQLNEVFGSKAVVFIFGGLVLGAPAALRAQYAESRGGPAEGYKDQVFDPAIRTVLLHPVGDELGFPALQLGTGSQLELNFDDLSSASGLLNYTFVHCDSRWNPSDIQSSQYISGYRSQYISDIRFSFNTFVPYSHYRLRFPSNEMNLTLSGNYILLVYESDPEQPLLSRRFVVYEQLADFSGRVVRPPKVDLMDTHQEVDFALIHPRYSIPNPFDDLSVQVLQNGRWDRSISNLQPRFIRDRALDYNYDGPNDFAGGNEWRSFDTKNDQALSLQVRRIELDSVFTFYLAEDRMRNIGLYSYLDDIDGRRVVRKSGSSDPHIEADYAWVDFALRPNSEWTGGSIFVYGALSDWKLDEDFRMIYDPSSKLYRAKILMKQGYCDYQYAVLGEDGLPDTGPVEGDRWETRNSYQLLAYHREVGLRYDRLIAFAQWTSAQGL
jgi:hypothetical protein